MLSWTASPVEVYVHRACDPSLHEPNYALNLELAEYINQKKANTPRDAAMSIARLVNHRNPHVSVLALSLLGTLVQSCGYPFHLQVSTKEFLNELVRRFPERPPPFPGPIMSRILDLIHSWKEGICKESRFKEDFGNIRDMHRLLSFKGYRFNNNSRSSTAVASQDTSVNLKSPDELESEDREAQSAKLQELIRRGTPRDLQAAQELMKILSGANPESKPDYRSKTLHELEKLQSHVILLNDMLDNVDPAKPERLVQGDAYDQVATICRNARPKLQKWISDAETDDPESLDTFLSINDLINNVLERYGRYQKGDFTAPPPPEPAQSSDLIDFDGAQSGSKNAGGNSTADDLLSVFGGSPTATSSSPSQAHQAISLGSGVFQLPSGPAASPPPPFQSSFSSITQSASTSAFGQPSQQHITPQTSSFGWSNGAPGSVKSLPGTQDGASLSVTPAASPSTPTSAAKKDAFADLEGLW